MHTREPTIIAMGGGGFMMEPENPLLDAYVLEATGIDQPRICFLGTACADRASTVEAFHATFSGLGARATHLALPWAADPEGPPELGQPMGEPNVPDLRAHLLAQDAIYVGGGNTRRMLAVWRHYGVDEVLHDLWASGRAVLAGVSAGALCWFESGVTDSIPGTLSPMRALGWVAGSFCPHYDGEPGRRPTYEGLVATDALSPGWAADDGCALHYRGDVLHRIVSSRPEAAAWRVEADAAGDCSRRHAPDYLGAPS